MTTAPGEGEDFSNQDEQPGPAWRSHPSDSDVDAAFAQIISGLMVEGGPGRHPSAGGSAAGLADPPAPPRPTERGETGAERARRRELRRLERAEEVAAFAARQAEVEAEREADEAHFTPPEPPPLPRPKGRTIGAVLMDVAGIVLLAKPGLLAIGPDLVLVMAAGLLLGGATLLLTGIWRRRGAEDGDDGAIV